MCGRLVRTSPAEALAARFGATVSPTVHLRPRWNLCPGEDLAIVIRRGDHRRLGTVQWGFVPGFASAAAPGPRAINARAETVATRPAFRDAFRRHRCLVAADGFYEWQRVGAARQPFFIRLRAREPMALAGLWDRWRPPGEAPPLLTGVVITCPATGRLAAIHDRMPVILSPDAAEGWLDPACDDPAALLTPVPDDLLEIHPVSRRVNSPRNDAPDLIDPVTPGAA